ncbi:MAG: VanW family protein [Eubacteriales bacterium]|nr:VanW family protein [Eubacteriales bacterium]
MAWEGQDLNDPALYTPREAPRVQKALPRGVMPAPGKQPLENVEPGEYLFDGRETWNESLENLPVYQPVPKAPAAAPDAENPYAKKRQNAVAGKHAAGRNVQTGVIPKGRPVLYAAVIIVCMTILAIVGVMMMPQVAGYFWKDLDNYAFINGEVLKYDSAIVKNYKQYRDYLQQDMIYQGIFVDSVYVGGMSIAQSEEALGGEGSAATSAFTVTVAIGNRTWNIDNTNIPTSRNLQSVLQEAYVIGRGNTTDIIGTSKTPFKERVDTVLGLLNQYVYLKSNATYDHATVRAKVDEIAAYVTRDPVDAQIQAFDFNARSFTFSDDQVGVAIDSDALYNRLIARLDAGAMNETLTVDPIVTTPAVTKAELMNRFTMVSAFTTDTTSAKTRNNNISLACQAINGTVLLPGETFSFNGTTGKRTTEKGYQMAPAIAGGQLVEDIGGGVCQVSSTLFNAVARADLEIVYRSPHAWPSTYVTIGEDATVDWPSLDFKFKNNKTTPVFIIMYYKDRQCSAEIWGLSLGTGVSVDLDSTIVKTIEPPTSVLYVQDTTLPLGTSEETIKARTGYVVDTYKVWYENGVETKREKFYTSTYKAYQRTVEYN